MKLHLIWDMDGTLVNSEPEIHATIQKSLHEIGLSLESATLPLKIGPPLPIVLRNSFSEDVLSDHLLEEVVKRFRKIYDSSEFVDTQPFEGIDEIVKSDAFVHHVITNKPDYATRRIIEKKGWNQYIIDVLSPNTLIDVVGRQMKKQELFQYFKANNPNLKVVGIGDMAGDAECANAVGFLSIGVLWGTGTKDEFQKCGCGAIVSNVFELKAVLNSYYAH
ncbi:MAG: HAD hydrolase-like protein [Bacteroidaceae bacterium]|nr:HAD hydrolase-like protein [Bacteroidaceae bacterium]